MVKGNIYSYIQPGETGHNPLSHLQLFALFSREKVTISSLTLHISLPQNAVLQVSLCCYHLGGPN